MKEVITSYKTAAEAENAVKCTEKAFRSSVLSVGESICLSGKRIVSLAGPTCSGKTTTASLLVKAAELCGKKVHVISIDDFYHGRDILLKKAGGRFSDIDMESINAIDFERLSESVKELLAGEDVEIPIFDFKSGRRIGIRSLHQSENDIFLFEGIQGLYPEITALFPQEASTKIYISVESPALFGKPLSGRTVRLMRRIVRDARVRNTTASQTFTLWKKVVENEKKSIEPHIGSCNLVIDSFHPYELSVIKKPLLEELSEDIGDEYTAERYVLTELLKDIEPLPESIVPKDSMYMEFLGS